MTRIVVTGAAGFIGSNLIRGLNERGIDDIIAVDNLTRGEKFHNLADLRIADYVDAGDFYEAFAQGAHGQVEAIFHEGACTNTLESNGQHLLKNNYTLSVGLFHACQKRGTRLLYASSAAVYGSSGTLRESPEFERPPNLHGYAKLLVDQRMRRECGAEFARTLSGRIAQVVGLRYFDVYGPREQHKTQMASLVFKQFQQLQTAGKISLPVGQDASDTGQHLRDYISVEDVVAVNLWFFDRPAHSGIFNVGSGQAHTMAELAICVLNASRRFHGQCELTLAQAVDAGLIEYATSNLEADQTKAPKVLQADLSALRAIGCDHSFTDLDGGVQKYVRALTSSF